MRSIIGISVALVLLNACSRSDNGGAIQPISDSVSVETVNGEPVPQALLEAIARGRSLDLNVAGQRQQALDELTQYVLLAQEAKREKFSSSVQFQANVEIARLQGVANATLTQIQQLSPISEAVLKAEYDQEVTKAGSITYDFNQLLFEQEDDAIKAAGDAVTGMPFAKVADAWKSKAKQARAFTQVRLSQIPDVLGKALQNLRPGETTKVPVKTEFGWHVVSLVKTTPYVPPSFEQSKEAIRGTLQAKIADQRINELKAKAQILPSVTAPAAPTTANESAVPRPKS